MSQGVSKTDRERTFQVFGKAIDYNPPVVPINLNENADTLTAWGRYFSPTAELDSTECEEIVSHYTGSRMTKEGAARYQKTMNQSNCAEDEEWPGILRDGLARWNDVQDHCIGLTDTDRFYQGPFRTAAKILLPDGYADSFFQCMTRQKIPSEEALSLHDQCVDGNLSVKYEDQLYTTKFFRAEDYETRAAVCLAVKRGIRIAEKRAKAAQSTTATSIDNKTQARKSTVGSSSTSTAEPVSHGTLRRSARLLSARGGDTQ